MRGRLLLTAAALLTVLAGPVPGADFAPPTQRQWLIDLVDAMGWSFGLPDRPTDDDYLALLAGRRRLRIEAEQAVTDDTLSVKRIESFGPYSGDGWLSGPAGSITNLNFLLPLGGTYRLSAALRQPGFHFTVDGQTFSATGDQNFGRIELGEVPLAAGEQRFDVVFPADGGLDYLELEAPDLATVAPAGGWQLDEPLTLDILAATVAQVLVLEALLPPDGSLQRIEAETAEESGAAQVTTASHLGAPSGGRWLRAGNTPVTLQLPFTVSAPGVYALSLRGASPQPIRAQLDDRTLLQTPAANFLQPLSLGSTFLEPGTHRLTLTLPPRGGVDLLEISGRHSQGTDYRRLVGLPVTGDYPTAADVDRLLALLAAIGTNR